MFTGVIVGGITGAEAAEEEAGWVACGRARWISG
jgi:hypothetical protein